MCDLCHGGTMEDVLLRMHLRIADGGWSHTAVQYPTRPGWTYTTGLCTNFEHPEIVVVGVDAHRSAHLLDEVCGFVRNGDRFTAGSEIGISGLGNKEAGARFVDVHPVHLQGGFTYWYWYYGSRSASMPELRALQLVVPQSMLWDADPRSQPLLDRTWPILDRSGNPSRRRGARVGHPPKRLGPQGW